MKDIEESLTLKVNNKIKILSSSGKKVYNLTSGQLNFRPPVDFIEVLKKELNFLSSFQYAPSGGFEDLRTKTFYAMKAERGLEVSQTKFSTIITNGSKAAAYLALGAILEDDDELILLKPFWGSYYPMAKAWKSKVRFVNSFAFNSYVPNIQDIEAEITEKTKVIILNSPNNPAGVHYDKEWMMKFLDLLQKYPDIYVISDEVYAKLTYFDPKPSYFYQFDESVLDRVIIVDGISKSMAATGLRVGYALAAKNVISRMIALQSHFTSAPSSLVQNALLKYESNQAEDFLSTVKTSIRNCAKILRDEIVANDMSHTWYQTTSGFYYFLDLTKYKYFEGKNTRKDFSEEFCEELLDKTGVALIPGIYFGVKNSVRVSLVSEESSFKEAVKRLMKFIN